MGLSNIDRVSVNPTKHGKQCKTFLWRLRILF